MTTKIIHKKSSVVARVPSAGDLEYGEIAINYADGRLYYKNSSNQIKSFLDSDQIVNLFDAESIPDTIFNVVNGGSSQYTFTGDGFSSSANNPTLYLARGKTYKFNVNASGHPFQIRVSNGGSAYGDGVVNNGAQVGAVYFTPDMDAPNTLVYQCTNHSGMVGDIVVVDAQSDTLDDVIGRGSTTTTSAVIPFYYANQSAFPSATTYHGAIAHSHSDGAMYFAHGGSWVELANSSSVFDGAFSSLTSKPTTLSGYGITDAQSTLVSGTNIKTINGSSLLGSGNITTSGGISNIVDDTTPQLGGNLDLNSNDITGTGDISINGSATLTSTDAGSAAGPDLILYRNSSSPADGDYLGQIQFKGRQDGPGDEIYAKVTGKITDASNGTEDGLIETAIKGNGSFTIVSRQRSDELQLINGVGLSVDGSLTASGLSYPSSDGSANQVLTTDGSGNLSFSTVSGGGGGTVDSAQTISLARGAVSVTTGSASGGGALAYNSSTGVLTFNPSTNSGGGGGASLANDVTLNSFAGDSSTTAFTLSTAPLTDQNVFVTINGVSQHVNAYSLNGSVLTFDSAPEVGDAIEARTIAAATVSLRDHQDYIYQLSTPGYVLSGADINGNTLSYDVDKMEVFLNGSRLTPALDYTATNGTSVTLLTDYPVDSSDTVTVSSFGKAYLIDRGVVPAEQDTPTAATQYVADTYSASLYRTSKYIIQLEHDSDNKYHSTEVLLTHDGTSVYMTEYGDVKTDSSLGTIDADISGGNVRLLVTPEYNNTSIKTQRITVGA